MESFEVNYAVRSYLIWWYLVLPETIGSPKRGELGQNRPRHFYLFLEIWFLDFTLFWKILIDPKSGRTGQNWGQKWPIHFFLRIFVWEFSDFLYKSRRPWAFENTVYENIYFAGNWSKVKPNEIKTEPLSYSVNPVYRFFFLFLFVKLQGQIKSKFIHSSNLPSHKNEP